MEIEDFPQANHTMRAGGNPNTQDARVGFAKIEVDGKTVPYTILKFKMTKEELDKFIETGELWVGIMGIGMPPIFPTPFNPYTTFGFQPRINPRDN